MKFLFNKNKNSRGFTIIEVIVACSIISITVFALMSSAQKGISLSNRAVSQIQANYLLEEGAEAVKTIRDNNWTDIENLSINTDYYLFFNTSTNMWSLSTSSVAPSGSIPTYPVDSIFNRTIKVSDVYRDANDDISDSGSLDSGTKKLQ